MRSHVIDRLAPPGSGSDLRDLVALLADAVFAYTFDPDGVPHDAVIFYKERTGARLAGG